MFDYDDTLDNYDTPGNYYDESYPQLFQTPAWNPRDAVLAWQTTSPDSRLYPDQRRPGLVSVVL